MARDLQEFYNGRNIYDLVLDFQKAFGHKYNPSKKAGDWQRLTGEERGSRAKWMAEEIMEYVSAGEASQIDQVDALVDLMYFIIGTFTMIGFDPFINDRLDNMAEYGRQMATSLHDRFDGWHPPPADRLYMGSPMTWRTVSAKYAIELVFNFVNSSMLGEDGQITYLLKLLDWTLKEAAVIGADLEPYFLIVHTANMTKLWPDGKPRYGSDGKIRKPETWTSPKKEMETHMLMELQQEDDDAEVPF